MWSQWGNGLYRTKVNALGLLHDGRSLRQRDFYLIEFTITSPKDNSQPQYLPQQTSWIAADADSHSWTSFLPGKKLVTVCAVL